MYTEDELLPISALQHLAFCPRQWGLIHLEQAWVENVFTAEGRALHERVHEEESQTRHDVRVARGLRVHSLRLGLVGQADVVEFRQGDSGIELPGADGLWRPFPVEYKRGKAKFDSCDEVQLCAGALCLEEMLRTEAPEGAFFYGRPRRRHPVAFDRQLRQKTTDLCKELHRLYQLGRTPKAVYSKKCQSCSLYEICLPKTTGVDKRVNEYIKKHRLISDL